MEMNGAFDTYNLFTQRRPSKAFYRIPKTTLSVYCHILLETISGLSVKIPLIQTKISLLWDFN